jgi:hypothetical protein
MLRNTNKKIKRNVKKNRLKSYKNKSNSSRIKTHKKQSNNKSNNKYKYRGRGGRNEHEGEDYEDIPSYIPVKNTIFQNKGNNYYFLDKEGILLKLTGSKVKNSQLIDIIENSDIFSDDSDSNIEELIKRLIRDLINYSGERYTNILFLLDDTLTKIIGYVYGYVDLNSKNNMHDSELSFVYINSLYRGRKLCTPLIETYIEHTTSLYSIKSFYLLNVGGTGACICYTNAFKNKGFLQEKKINCLESETDDFMEFYKVN